MYEMIWYDMKGSDLIDDRNDWYVAIWSNRVWHDILADILPWNNGHARNIVIEDYSRYRYDMTTGYGM